MSVQASLFRLYSRYQMARLPDDPIRQRAAMEKYASLLKLPSDVGCEQFNVSNVPCEWITTPSAHPDWIHFHLHGGAYYMGSSRSHRDLVSRIGRAAGMRSLAIDYRLAPEYPFPAALEDATNVYRWLLVEGFDPTKIVLTGASAGGGLALALLIYLRQAGDPLPAGAVCLSPWTDLALTGESVRSKAKADPFNKPESMARSARMYAREHDLKLPFISPLYADLQGLPPLLLQVGTEETLLDDSTRLAERARVAGVDVALEVWKGMIHVFQLSAILVPEARRAIERIGEFMYQLGHPRL